MHCEEHRFEVFRTYDHKEWDSYHGIWRVKSLMIVLKCVHCHELKKKEIYL